MGDGTTRHQRRIRLRPVAAARVDARMTGSPPGPSRAELVAAAGRTIADVAGPGLSVLFCGINPGLYSAATGYHFARPGNRFWPSLHESGFTDRLLRPSEQEQLLGYGLGITNIVARSTARADELSRAELVAGGKLLAAKVTRLRPRWLAVVGVTAYRTAFGLPRAAVGPQDDLRALDSPGPGRGIRQAPSATIEGCTPRPGSRTSRPPWLVPWSAKGRCLHCPRTRPRRTLPRGLPRGRPT